MKSVPGKIVFIQLSLFAALLVALPGLVSGNTTTFFEGYDKAIRPGFENGKPTTIRSNIYIESFGNIEEANMEYKVYTYFRQLWIDPRLAGKANRTFTLMGGEIDNIWVPDPFCYNARESNMMMPNEEIHSFVHIQPSGDIVMSKGVTLLASCVMNLQHFPLDSQTCSLKIGSYAYSTKDLVYEWIPGEVAVGNKEMAQFDYKGAELTSDVEVFSVGNFSTITVTFLFQRRIGYYLIQIYFPTIFVVMLSWIVFFMEKDDIGNRMALGITTILTIMFLLGSLNGNLPKVSYPKALDWFLLVSFSFVFLSLMECIIVYVLLQASKKENKINLKAEGNTLSQLGALKYKHDIPLSERVYSSLKSAVDWKSEVSLTKSKHANNGNKNVAGDDDFEMADNATKTNRAVLEDDTVDDSVKIKTMEKVSNAIDGISRFLFPLTFIAYNIFYWTYY